MNKNCNNLNERKGDSQQQNNIRMTSALTYEYLAKLLSKAMEDAFKATRKPEYKTKTLIGLGRAGKRSDWVETLLCELFERHICFDKSKLVLVGEDGGTLYAFNGRYYERIGVKSDKFMTELVKRSMRELQIGAMYVQKCSEAIAKSIVSTLTSSDEYLYKPDRRYIAFANGIFDLEKGRLKQFDNKYRPYIALDMEYQDGKTLYQEYDKKYGVSREKNPAKLWEWKIGEIIPNKDMRDAFQQFCGSLLVDRDSCKVEYICYLVGSGSNGKSVVASAIAGVFGDDFFSRFSLKQLFKDSDARVNIAALEGKICNLVGDLEAKDVDSGGDFKRAVSGEKFQGRRNYKDPIMVRFPPLLCCTNSLPESSDDSWGYHRRQLPISTTTHQWTEEDKDPMLGVKLTCADARRYIFTWIYDGYKKIMRNGGNIKLGEEVVKAQKRLQNYSNSARAWWSDGGYVLVGKPEERKDPRWRLQTELYAEYKAYAKEQGYAHEMKAAEVYSMIKSQGAVADVNYKRAAGTMKFCVGRLGRDTTESGELIHGVHKS